MENLFENISKNDLQIVPEDLTNAEPKKIADKIVNILDIKKGGDIKLLEVHSRTVIADYFVICTANSTTQVKSLADELEYQMTLCNTPPAHTDGMGRGEWSVLDFSSVIVHIFIKSAREFYKLDKLWGDTTELEINSEE
ncbi:MAG: ribosome silencing factor [Clostridia bacterium]|nr:ribosome silencing factor [Clostridia bacterium]